MTKAPMEQVVCNLCGGARHRAIYRMPDAWFHPDEWFTIVECLDCGLGFVNPRPPQEAMDRYYPPAFFDYFRRDAQFHRERYRREARFLPTASPENGRQPQLLDIGCANGDFPRFARELGWQVEGVEIAQSADAIKDFPVYRVPFPEIPIAEPRYDAITAWAVIEHVHDPMAYFRKAADVMMPGGRFVFLVTNFESVSSRALYREDPPRHLFFFSERTVKRYLDEVGLTLERSLFDGSIYEMVPLHWLRYYLRLMLRLPPLAWDELPETRLDYCRRRGLGDGVSGRLIYSLAHPFTTVDRLLAPCFSKWQELTRSYGIGVFVARKP